MSLVFENISHDYGKISVLKQVSLRAHAGEILCLLGPSGCGKTTLLNLAAGILPLQEGLISLDGSELASAQDCPPPEKRPVGLVFQEGALFPHLSASDNIKFGILQKPDREAVATELLGKIGLADFGDRYPHSLSGGQQQRVAVARALAPSPRVILMDEPFANIDISLRRSLREQIRHLLKSQNCITIIVTHDPEEAMEISDQIAVMLDGEIVQAGSPKDIYNTPKSSAVARLTSEGAVITAAREGQTFKTKFGDWPLSVLNKNISGGASDKLELFIRPFSVELEVAGSAKTELKLIDIRHIGSAQIVSVQASCGQVLNLHMSAEPLWEIGQFVKLRPRKASLIGFPI